MTDETPNAYKNYDLKAEHPTARKPTVRFVFEFPELLAQFESDDSIANAARRRSRLWGYLAIVLVLTALLMASFEMLFHDNPSIGYVAGALGVIGTVLGLGGMSRYAARRVWLHHRLRTETLRLFHFHFIAARLPRIADAAHPLDEAQYLQDREKAFRNVLKTLDDPKRELKHIVERSGEVEFNTFETPAAAAGHDIPPLAADIFEVWRALRLDWQLGYCNAKLQTKKEWLEEQRKKQKNKNDVMPKRPWNPLRVEKAFSWFGWACVGLIVIFDLTHFVFGALHWKADWFAVFVIWTALIALAARALEDGLQPQREVERYEGYRANISAVIDRFGDADGLAAKIGILRGFERTSLEEMRVFMRTHARSRFLL
jgi:hypothetical protein